MCSSDLYIATQYNKTKTKTKGATNGGSNSNNNNNTSNTNKNNKTDRKNKRNTKEQIKNWMEKNDVRITTNIPYELTDPDLTGKLSSLETVGPIVSVSKVGDSFNFPNAESVVGQIGRASCRERV